MLRLSTSLFLCLAALLGGPACAQDLYSGAVPVEGQGVAERRSALPGALIQVLQKLSGQRDLSTYPALDQRLGEAERMLRSFQYAESDRTLPDGQVESRLELIANFSPEAVDELVRTLQLPRWRTERKPIVWWVVVDEGRGRELQPVEYQYAWDTVEGVARLRGLPVAWPGLSEAMKETVDLQLLWGGFTDQLLVDGSHSDGVVIVAARREGPDWNLRWTFSDSRAASSWRTRDRELAYALVEGVHQLTDLVASVNSIGPAGQGRWESDVLIAGLREADDYARCLNYLEGLSLVDGVTVTRAGESGVGFRLVLNAEPDYLYNELRRGGRLQPSDERDVYRWVPQGKG